MTTETHSRPPATVTAWTAAGDPREDGAHTTIGYVRAGSILVYVYESTVTPGVIVFDIDSGGQGDDLPAVKVVINDDTIWPQADEEQDRCDICDVDHIALDDTCEDHEDDRTCTRCQAVVQYLTTDDLCDGCATEDDE